MSFDVKTAEALRCYVYVLSDPDTNKPFYIGKGTGNRVFDHVKCSLEKETRNDKCDTIRAIHAKNKKVQHRIVRHGLNEKTAYHVESALIDYLSFLGHKLTNEVRGHHSIENGLMTTDEVSGKYNAKCLEKLDHPAVIININKTYKRGDGVNGVYKATKEKWVIAEFRRNTLVYALAEYKGLIVEVFKIDEWYPAPVTDKNGKPKIRWGFNGRVAEDSTHEKYINKSVAHIKKPGASNPIRYNL